MSNKHIKDYYNFFSYWIIFFLNLIYFSDDRISSISSKMKWNTVINMKGSTQIKERSNLEIWQVLISAPFTIGTLLIIRSWFFNCRLFSTADGAYFSSVPVLMQLQVKIVWDKTLWNKLVWNPGNSATCSSKILIC